MPHVTVKLWPGRIEEVERSDWGEKVYKKEIRDNMENIYFKPDYEYE